MEQRSAWMKCVICTVRNVIDEIDLNDRKGSRNFSLPFPE